jgi:predicted SnoaL-like aldol condensation-catalyzing enzyme
MKNLVILMLLAMMSPAVVADDGVIEARNKALALGFYEDLWFTDNTDKYIDYVADQYVIHDVGPNKGVTENAVMQKDVADRFHSFGKLSGKIDYQIADGDKVATRWWVSLEPNEAALEMGMTPVDGVAIINVFRFNDEGKIVEIWNHRHDVELPQPPEGPRGVE